MQHWSSWPSHRWEGEFAKSDSLKNFYVRIQQVKIPSQKIMSIRSVVDQCALVLSKDEQSECQVYQSLEFFDGARSLECNAADDIEWKVSCI